MRTALLITALSLSFAASTLQANEPAPRRASHGPIADAVADAGRTEANRARDSYRHPVETLSFFGVKPSDTIVEIWPGGGWYSEILGPLTRNKGKLYLAAPSRAQASLKAMIAEKPSLSEATAAIFPAEAGATAVPDGVADVVLTFRNVHNWRFGGKDNTQTMFNQLYAMLKPGGILGVVDHRLPEDMDSALEEKSGYIKKSSVVGFAKAAGFELVDKSSVNANPKDSHDWPEGVWTLPPTLKKGDVDREKYQAIGESDRMTLKFRKPL